MAEVSATGMSGANRADDLQERMGIAVMLGPTFGESRESLVRVA